MTRGITLSYCTNVALKYDVYFMPVKIIILYEFIMLLNNIDVHVYLQIELNHNNKRE